MGLGCYTSGAFIEPVKDVDGKYHWQVTQFNESTFDEFGNRFDLEVVANTALGLLNEFDNEGENVDE